MLYADLQDVHQVLNGSAARNMQYYGGFGAVAATGVQQGGFQLIGTHGLIVDEIFFIVGDRQVY